MDYLGGKIRNNRKMMPCFIKWALINDSAIDL